MDLNEEEHCACDICGNQTSMTGTKMCDRCWELDRRIRNDFDLAVKIVEAVKEERAK